jgi:hypothetical protein
MENAQHTEIMLCGMRKMKSSDQEGSMTGFWTAERSTITESQGLNCGAKGCL